MEKKILILSNHFITLYNFRKELIKRLLSDGYKVYISVPKSEENKFFIDMGCEIIETAIERRGKNPFADIMVVKNYYSLVKKINPDIVLSYTIKPNLYGGFVCRLLKIPIISNITGLGTAVWNGGIIQKILVIAYKVALKKTECVFFQNESNKDFFIDNKIKLKKYKVIPGSGINLSEYTYQEYPQDNDNIKFLFVGRIMKDKGIEELIESAKVIKNEYQKVQFDAIGFFEDEYKDKIERLQEKNIITFHGIKNNVLEYIKNSHAIIHPTYHEGMSNVLLEASASGRPVLASNIPGCKEIFDEGISGFGFEPQNVEGLTKTMHRFISLSHEEKLEMGKNGRKKVEKDFDREVIVELYLNEINKILERK